MEVSALESTVLAPAGKGSLPLDKTEDNVIPWVDGCAGRWMDGKWIVMNDG